MTRTELGKIQSISFGFGGYDDAMFGASFTLGGSGWGVGDFNGTWATWSKGCKWSKEEQKEHLGNTVLFLRDLCAEAKVKEVSKLKGIPVEVVFEDNTLKSWRVLKEVL